MTDYLLPGAAIAGGLLLLVQAGDRLVRHAARLAVNFRVPKTVVGAVILGFGTSLPELFVSLTASIEGSPGLALGNVVGSNIANVGLILGFGALLGGLGVERKVVRLDLPLGLLATLFLLIWVGPREAISRVGGAALLLVFLLYLWGSLRYTRTFRLNAPRSARTRFGWDLFWIVTGLVGLALGAHLLVWGGVRTAELLDVSERVIGLSLVACGTSLPELAATVAAVRKGEADLAVGNLAGSNLFNLLFVLGLTAVTAPHGMEVERAMTERDFPAVALFSVLAFPLLSRRNRIEPWQGALLLSGYVAYIAWTWWT